ncbi:hypothetical protein JCM10207_001667 [Rhodosporidiobolus poonsookiae]
MAPPSSGAGHSAIFLPPTPPSSHSSTFSSPAYQPLHPSSSSAPRRGFSLLALGRRRPPPLALVLALGLLGVLLYGTVAQVGVPGVDLDVSGVEAAQQGVATAAQAQAQEQPAALTVVDLDPLDALDPTAEQEHQAEQGGTWWTPSFAVPEALDAARADLSSSLSRLRAKLGLSPLATSSSSLDPAGPSLPGCQRTLLFRLTGHHGFASEYLRFVRLAGVVQRWGVEVEMDGPGRLGGAGEKGEEGEGGWMYGSWDDYFNRTFSPSSSPSSPCSFPPSFDTYYSRAALLPHKSDVLPPLAPTAADAALEEGEDAEADEPDQMKVPRYREEAMRAPWWAQESGEGVHLRDGHDRAYLSALTLSSLSAASLRALHTLELSPARFPPSLPIPAAQLVPRELWGVFEEQAGVVRRWWVVRDGVRAQVERLKEALVEGGQRVVGIHLRLGDKCAELSSPKYSPLRFTTPSQLRALRAQAGIDTHAEMAACVDNPDAGMEMQDAEVYGRAVIRLLEDGEKEQGKKHEEKAKVVIMSDDPRGPAFLLAAWRASPDASIRALGEGSVEVVALAEEAERLGLRFKVRTAQERVGEGEEKEAKEEGEAEGLMGNGFNESRFRAAPLSTRVALTLPFLRDLTFLSEACSGLVLTGSSNVGRLLTLLAGPEMVKRERVVSADVRWFPTAYYV